MQRRPSGRLERPDRHREERSRHHSNGEGRHRSVKEETGNRPLEYVDRAWGRGRDEPEVHTLDLFAKM